MPSISAFPACCGAVVITGFEEDPSGNAGWKIKLPEYAYEKDEKGNNIPLTFYERFTNDLTKQQQAYPGRMYCCILTERQINQSKGAWLPLLKKSGFEFVRRWSNSVHSDREFLYLFVLCTDEKGKCKNDFTQPPKGWDALPGPVREEPKPTTFQKLSGVVSKAA